MLVLNGEVRVVAADGLLYACQVIDYRYFACCFGRIVVHELQSIGDFLNNQILISIIDELLNVLIAFFRVLSIEPGQVKTSDNFDLSGKVQNLIILVVLVKQSIGCFDLKVSALLFAENSFHLGVKRLR